MSGNGGFVGNFLAESFIKEIVIINEDISYYFLITFIIILFFQSINFKFNYLISFKNFLFKRNTKKEKSLEQSRYTNQI